MKTINKEIHESNQLAEASEVIKYNAMLENIYKLSALEQKLMLVLCSKILSSDNVLNSFEISVKEFANFMNIDNKDYELNRTLKKKCKELSERTLKINKGNEKRTIWYVFNWFHHVQYEAGRGNISIQFHEDLLPYLLDFKNQYTKNTLRYVMNFKSKYSFKMYDLMKAYEKIGERTLPIEYLRICLNIDKEKYTKYSHFKERVIKPAIQEINKYTDINIKLSEEEKEGKKIVGLTFEISTNNDKCPIDNLLETKTDIPIHESEVMRNFLELQK